jgi:hypothetical protein
LAKKGDTTNTREVLLQHYTLLKALGPARHHIAAASSIFKTWISEKKVVQSNLPKQVWV